MVKEKKEDSAIFYFNKTIDIIDSANLKAGLEASKDLQTKYETEKKRVYKSKINHLK